MASSAGGYRELSTGEYRIRIRWRGSIDTELGATLLVVLHGALASSAHVLGELAPLLERFRVHAVDIVGHEWLVDVLDGLALARPHVVGVSLAASSRSGSPRSHPSGSTGSRYSCRRGWSTALPGRGSRSS